ncbi:tRNA guanosine(34) transglycosylase Tgt [Patescibacteria group bacterium]|nr:tRNA guanosine(34) transglycosylase Tgt [Patescibacteria group bacterium]
MAFSFSIEKGGAIGPRAGEVFTPHGTFKTPAFVPVGTKATVKGVLPKDLKDLAGAEVALGNTYHLFLQPGEDVVAEAGGLHSFMGWDGPLFTDSGGYQVFSLGVGYGKSVSKFSASTVFPESDAPAVFDPELATQHGKLAIVDDDGVSFTSHLDGTLFRFTPERSVEIQHKLGADIFFAFDEFRKPDDPRAEQIEAMRRTYEWAQRSLSAHRQNVAAGMKQAIFGIVQGGRYTDLRTKSAKEIGDLAFDGYGIGGTFSKADLGDALSAATLPLPPEKPRHLLGIGEPEDIFEGVAHGMDSFDCTIPTRLGRTGVIYTARGKVNILNEKYIRDFSPLDPETGGYASETFTKGYLAHLFRAKEMLGGQIATLHNLYFFTKLLKDIRNSILEDKFDVFREEFLARYVAH